MDIKPISIYSCNQNKSGINRKEKEPSFKAVLLKDNVMFVDKMTQSPINSAIVELETETRELIADSRRKHEHDISEEEYTERIDKWNNRQRVMDRLAFYEENGDFKRDIYRGDYNLMEELAQRDELPFIKEINERVKENDMYMRPFDEGNFATIREFWTSVTKCRAVLSPEGYEGLLDKGLYNYIWRFGKCPTDSYIYGTVTDTKADAPRQRVLLAVEHQRDGNYRDIPASKVLGIAEIYTDRAMDVIEEMASDEEKRIAASNPAGTDYKNIGTEIMQKAKLPLDRIIPVNICLMGAFEYLTNVGKALLDAICEKGRYCGICTENHSLPYTLLSNKGFKSILGEQGNKLLKPGFLSANLKV